MEKSSVEVNRRVKLENLFDEEIIVEKSSERDKSVFAPIYKKAEKLVDDFKFNSNKYQDDESRLEKMQIVNTISFEGRRGTGKTSAMMSFCDQLRDKKELYIVLDYIDASTLEEGESILEIVLANMYHLLVEHMEKNNKSGHYDYAARNIIRKFEEIYSAIGFINERRSKDGRRVDLSPLSGLERLSNSQQLKKTVYGLIREYKKHIASDDAMLVIPIDDIDMCFQSEEPSVYEIMETLHRYLMIPNVIVFLTYDYPELLSGCEKHFSQMHYIKDDITKGQKDHIREAANRYLEKVLPTYARIHLPSQRKRDYSDQNNIQVCLEHDEAKKYLKKFKEKTNLNPKEFALLFKASNCGLFYDSQGKKRHFAEPTDFRDMVHIVTMCKQLMDSYDKNTDDDDELVFKELLDDLYFRFARVNLVTEEEGKRYNEYLGVNIERRSRNILDDICILLEKKTSKKKRKGENSDDSKYGLSRIQFVDRSESTNRDRNANQGNKLIFIPDDETSDRKRSYSYGELLYGLYCASSSGVFSKPLIWCILDSYTIMLTKLYRSIERKKQKCYKDNEKLPYDNAEEKLLEEIKNADAYKSLKRLIGPSISSSWSNMFVPNLKFSVDGSKKNNNGNQEFPRPGAIKFSTFSNSVKKRFKWGLAFEENDYEDKDIIQTIEILCMLFSNVKNNEDENENSKGFNISFIRGADYYEFAFEFTSGCFNIMNFVNNLFFGEEFFDILHKRLVTPLKDYWNLNGEDSENEQHYKKKLNDCSLYKDYVNWKLEYKSCAMPLYSFDIMYNILKRQYKETLKKNPYITNEEVDGYEFIKRLLNVYSEIENALEEQDKFYITEFNTLDKKAKMEEAPPVANFKEAFKQCPFMRYMNGIKDNIDNNKQDIRTELLIQFLIDFVSMPDPRYQQSADVNK